MNIKINPNATSLVVRQEVVQAICDAFLNTSIIEDVEHPSIYIPNINRNKEISTSYICIINGKSFFFGDYPDYHFKEVIYYTITTEEMRVAIYHLLKAGYFVFRCIDYNVCDGVIYKCINRPYMHQSYRAEPIFYFNEKLKLDDVF